MNNRSASKRIFGILTLFVGSLLALALTAGLTWASLEAEFYGFQHFTYDRFDGLSCPLVMTPHETGIIVMDVKNPAAVEIEPILRIDTSTPEVADTKQTQVKIQPGQTWRFEQTISAGNIDLGNFIFAKAYRYASYPTRDAETTCGILVLDVPFLTGGQIFAIWLALSLGLTCLGLWLWLAGLQGNDNDGMSGSSRDMAGNAARALVVVVMVGLFFGIKGLWLPGILIIAVAILLMLAVARFLSQV
jgi:hypothetical protein